MRIGQLITGIVLIVIGIVLIVLPFFFKEKAIFFTWIYGIPLLIIGIVILLNKKEDEIELIKSRKVNLKKSKR